MATGGINYDDPEVQKGFALFNYLFRDRLNPSGSPKRVVESKKEPDEAEVQKGYELFEQLFWDRLHPPEPPEETVEDAPESPEEIEESPESPEKIVEPTPSPREVWKKKGFSWASPPEIKITPPEWLVRDTDRDFIPPHQRPQAPDWFRHFMDRDFQSTPKVDDPDRPPEPTSPQFWSPALLMVPRDDVFAGSSASSTSPDTPPSSTQGSSRIRFHPGSTPEPPIPYEYFDNSYDEFMHQMQHEVKKYDWCKRLIEEYARKLPLLREYQILMEELPDLVKLYIPGANTEDLDLYVAFDTLRNYVEETEEKINEKHGGTGIYQFKFPGISDEVAAAELPSHKERLLDAIDSLKQGYFVCKHFLIKANRDIERLEKEKKALTEELENLKIETEKYKREESEIISKHEQDQVYLHFTNCPFYERYVQASHRDVELNALIKQKKKELEASKASYEKDVKNMYQWVCLFPPNLEKRIYELLIPRVMKDPYEPVPMTEYMDLVKTLTSDLQVIQERRERSLNDLEKNCERYQKILKEKEAQLEEIRSINNELKGEQENLSAERASVLNENENRKGLWAKLLEEKLHYQTYNELLLGKIITLSVSASVRSDGLPAIAFQRSRSPSPAVNTSGNVRSVSPPAFSRSGTFSVTQRESSPTLSGSPDILDDEQPPFGSVNISNLSQNAGSDESEGSPQGQTVYENVDAEHLPAEMSGISGISREGGSEISDDSPQGQANVYENLGDDQPASEILDISGSGGASASEGSPEGEAESDNLETSWGLGESLDLLDEERPPSEMLNFSDFSASGSGSPYDSLKGSGSPYDSLKGSGSPIDSLKGSATSVKKTVSVLSPGKKEQLLIDVEIIPQDIRRSPSGRKVVCDLAVEMQEAASKGPRGFDRRNLMLRGTPAISQTVGRRFDRRYGMFTPKSAIKRGHISVRRPLFEGDYESPPPPWGSGRKTHPELMNLPPRVPSPRPPKLDTTIEWETKHDSN